MSRRGRSVVGASVASLVLVGVGGWLYADRVAGVSLYGCTTRENEWAVTISKDAAVTALAPRYLLVQKPYTACEDDDRYVTAVATYKSPDTWEHTKLEVMRVAESKGWHWRKDIGGCFAKDIDGHRVVLHISRGDPAGGRSDANLGISLSGSMKEPERCSS